MMKFRHVACWALLQTAKQYNELCLEWATLFSWKVGDRKNCYVVFLRLVYCYCTYLIPTGLAYEAGVSQTQMPSL